MSQFEKFVADGNQKADELVKAVRCWTRDLRRKRERRSEKRCAQPLAVCTQLSLLGGGIERL